MNGLTKFLILTVLFIGFSIGSFWLIFSQGLVFGLLIGFILLLLCLAALGLSLYGIDFGHLENIRLNTPLEVAGLLILTVYLSAAIVLFGVSNSLLELQDITKDYSVSDKTDMLLSSFWNSDPNHLATGSIEKNGISYSFTASTEDEVEKIDAFLQAEKDRIADFYGNEEPGNLTLVFHDDFDTLSEASGYEEAMGYYDYDSQEIHIVPDDYSWDIILLHEYAHHQSHLYAENNGLSPTRLPLWFEEGTADYLAGETSDWYELSEVEVIDFKQLDTDYSFHNSYSRNFDPYVQSFLAVESLVNEYGEELLPTFLAAKMPSEFYGLLEEATGMKLADFQASFMDKMIEESTAEQAKYDAAFAALDRGDFAEAQQIIDELTENASEEDLNQLSWMQTDVLLMQDQFDEAIVFMEERLEKGDPEYRIDDLTTLAELYVLIEPAKSLELIVEADALLQDDEDLYIVYYDLDGYLEAYELINSSSPYEGYMILLEEELLYNETIIEQVEEKVENDFPEAS
ncbi:hypothetical protein [Planococcus salinarum]|uniref:hypothetical protein n=1 Tax=Planococcus salinarum TaxID=622695 RepID=UPI000E3C093C|nr:hypothetical protein [Planococcus salinarum]TAA73120.1 hypothetical protein D2909_03545 [Planococcus salinarum]